MKAPGFCPAALEVSGGLPESRYCSAEHLVGGWVARGERVPWWTHTLIRRLPGREAGDLGRATSKWLFVHVQETGSADREAPVKSGVSRPAQAALHLM